MKRDNNSIIVREKNNKHTHTQNEIILNSIRERTKWNKLEIYPAKVFFAICTLCGLFALNQWPHESNVHKCVTSAVDVEILKLKNSRQDTYIECITILSDSINVTEYFPSGTNNSFDLLDEHIFARSLARKLIPPFSIILCFFLILIFLCLVNHMMLSLSLRKSDWFDLENAFCSQS